MIIPSVYMIFTSSNFTITKALIIICYVIIIKFCCCGDYLFDRLVKYIMHLYLYFIGGVLAHAFYPRNGDIHFDEDEGFTSGTPSGTNLHYVALHELGHSLGIKHTDIRGAVMYPYYKYLEDPQLHQDDIDAIQANYGTDAFFSFHPKSLYTLYRI